MNNYCIYQEYLNILKPKFAHPYEENINGADDVLLNLLV